MLEARGLTKAYGDRTVVNGLDLDAHRGEVLGLLGPNGAGKTTALRMLYGFIEPEAGSITYDGRDFKKERTALERLIGVCTQDDTLDADFSVAQNLWVYAAYFRPKVSDLGTRVDELIDRFELRPFADTSPIALSGGYKQRLLIARSIVHRPSILFLDEPTTGLDPAARVELWRLVDQLREEGLSVVLTTHYMDEAERLSDRLCVLQEGRAVARGQPSEVLGALVGEQMLVVDRNDPLRGDLEQFLSGRAIETHSVLGEMRAPLHPVDHAALLDRFPDTRFALREPNLDDLFLLLTSRQKAESTPTIQADEESSKRDPVPLETHKSPPTVSEAMVAAFDWRSWAVFRRNALVYLRNWRTAFLPPALEPVVYLLAIGIGLDRYVAGLPWGGKVLSYPDFVAPGLLAYAAFVTPFYESLYSAYVRIVYQKTWDGILATQVGVPHLVWGEILWASARGVMNGSVVAGVLAIFQMAGVLNIHLAGLVPLLPAAFFAGLAFAAAGLIFTAIVPAIDHMNYPVFLVGLPVSFFSNTFFPMNLGNWGVLLHINPVFQLAELCRSVLVLGHPGVYLPGLLVTGGGLLVLLVPRAIHLCDQRVHRAW